MVRIALTEKINGQQLELRSIVFHKGTDNAGHWFAQVKRGHMWYECDDEKPVQLLEDGPDLLSGNAAMLLYEKS